MRLHADVDCARVYALEREIWDRTFDHAGAPKSSRARPSNQQILALSRAGLASRQIADRYGLTPQAMRKFVKVHDLAQ